MPLRRRATCPGTTYTLVFGGRCEDANKKYPRHYGRYDRVSTIAGCQAVCDTLASQCVAYEFDEPGEYSGSCSVFASTLPDPGQGPNAAGQSTHELLLLGQGCDPCHPCPLGSKHTAVRTETGSLDLAWSFCSLQGACWKAGTLTQGTVARTTSRVRAWTTKARTSATPRS